MAQLCANEHWRNEVRFIWSWIINENKKNKITWINNIMRSNGLHVIKQLTVLAKVQVGDFFFISVFIFRKRDIEASRIFAWFTKNFFSCILIVSSIVVLNKNVYFITKLFRQVFVFLYSVREDKLILLSIIL